MAKTNNKKKELINYCGFEYKMPEAMANAYLNARKGDEKKKHPQAFLCDLVNEEFGVKGECTRVVIS